jgi:diadenylate cyclase
MNLTRFQDLWARVGSYPAWEIALELGLIAVVVYAVLTFVQGTRAAGALKGLLILVIVITVLSRLMGGTELFQRLGFLYERFLTLVAVALIVIFQPELRRALVRIGETPFFRSTPKDLAYVVDEISEACGYLAKARFGGLIVIERTIGVSGLVEGGTRLNAELSAPLLQTIFFPGSALHDLAVIVRGRTVAAAGAQLPLAEPADMPDPRLGSRHRAAVGLSKECDAVVCIVSEETGKLRIAERGRLSRPMDIDDFTAELRTRLSRAAQPPSIAGAPDTASPAPAPSESELAGDSSPEAGEGGFSSISGETLVNQDAIREPLSSEAPEPPASKGPASKPQPSGLSHAQSPKPRARGRTG